MADELLDRARQLAELLSARGIAHAFIGGLAMNAWTIPVPTYDIDLCAKLTPEDVPDLIAELDRAGFVPPETSWIEAIGSARFQEFTVHWPRTVSGQRTSFSPRMRSKGALFPGAGASNWKRASRRTSFLRKTSSCTSWSLLVVEVSCCAPSRRCPPPFWRPTEKAPQLRRARPPRTLRASAACPRSSLGVTSMATGGSILPP